MFEALNAMRKSPIKKEKIDGAKKCTSPNGSLLKWNMIGEVLIPGVLNVGDIKNTDGCKQAAELAEKI